MQISCSLLCCSILQAAYYVDILIIALLHNIVGSVLCRLLGHYFAAQYCRQSNLQISWSLLCCTILQAVYYVDILFITLLHNIAAQYCRQHTIYISWSLLCGTILQAAYYLHIFVITLLHCTVAAYNVDILVITLLQYIVGSVLCRYLGHYFAAQYCRQRTMQIIWSLLCCTILQAAYYVDILVAAYYVDILVVTLLHNTVGSVLCRYVGCYFSAHYCRQRTLQMSWSLLCYTILQAVYYVDILFITLLHNIAAQYCRQCTIYISWSLLCCTILQQRTMQISCSLLCCTILQAAYYVDMLVVTLLHNIVGSVLCRYLGRYLAAPYCRKNTMQIFWSLLCCTILQAAFYVDYLVITLLHNIAGRVLCRYLSHYFAAQYCGQRTMQISWSLLSCTILQAA